MSGPRFTKASVVGAQHARATWALAARELLVETAGRYHAVVGYAELAEFVQQRSLISTTQQVGGWMGDVLHRVGEECARRAEPNLAALAVNAKGSVGDGYARSVAALYGEQVTDPDEHAARVRLECYRRFGADLPAGGGEPALAPALQKTRTAPRSTKAAAAPKAEPKPPALCPRCFTTLPATGICDYCD